MKYLSLLLFNHFQQFISRAIGAAVMDLSRIVLRPAP